MSWDSSFLITLRAVGEGASLPEIQRGMRCLHSNDIMLCGRANGAVQLSVHPQRRAAAYTYPACRYYMRSSWLLQADLARASVGAAFLT